MTEPRLKLTGVKKRFGATEAVRDVSLSIAPGEFVSLLGPSGCGKSTTLAMVAGFLEPDAGTITVEGKAVNGVPPERRRIGLVFQDYAVFGRLTVRDNLLFGLEAQQVARAERMPRVQRMADLLDLTKLLERRGGSLNMSEMQRVALGRALVTEPGLLLLDEPMSNLDAALRASLRNELRRIQRRLRQSVLYVTHDQVEAMAMSDRIAVMNNGEILQIGTPDEIYRRPINRFVAEFIGDPPINILRCAILGAGGKLTANTAIESGIVVGRGRLLGAEYLLAIRPQDILLRADRHGPEGIVRLVEFLGSQDVAYVAYDDELVAVATPHGKVKPGDRIHLSVRRDTAHLINAETGIVVQPRDEAMVA